MTSKIYYQRYNKSHLKKPTIVKIYSNVTVNNQHILIFEINIPYQSQINVMLSLVTVFMLSKMFKL